MKTGFEEWLEAMAETCTPLPKEWTLLPEELAIHFMKAFFHADYDVVEAWEHCWTLCQVIKSACIRSAEVCVREALKARPFRPGDWPNMN